MILEHQEKQYEIGKLVAETSDYRIYVCIDLETNRECLLQITVDSKSNTRLDKAAFILKKLRKAADEYEAEYAKTDPAMPLSYERLFPELLASFVPPDQGGRRVNIMAIADVDELSEVTPLTNVLYKDGQRIDLGTSAWVMGRLLKLIAFAHEQGLSNLLLSMNNILIHPKRHNVIVLDWSDVVVNKEKIPGKVRKTDIANAATSVFTVIGGDPKTGEYGYSDNAKPEYTDLLWRFASHREKNAFAALNSFYDLVDQHFKREFKPYKTLPR